tara:strand:- start:4650 stop:6212 length:1563 start_codon:yes stop_codon:yes gene_type:complete
MNCKVCIPTAGIGSRVKDFSKGLNKSLIEINNKPVISYIIEKYDENAEFIIPTGYGANELKQFLKLAYPNRNFKFINISLFEGEGSGLGYTLLKTKEFLQEPFIFNSCDTIIKGKIPNLENNWVGFSLRKNTKGYRTINEKDGLVKYINDKNEKSYSEKVYIGLAGIKDYKLFWKNVEKNYKDFIDQGESFGLKNLLNKNIEAIHFNWFDTGNPVELKKTKNSFKKKNNHNILEKEGESIWFVNNKVIKYSKDKEFIKNRIKRSKILKDFVPFINSSTTNMYSYLKEEGEILSHNLSEELFKKLLDYLKIFWIKRKINNDQKKYFFLCCSKFYQQKTLERISQFLKKYPQMKDINEINSKKVVPLETLFERINWQEINNGIIGRFHGDFHFENIIWNSKKKKFIFLDWRQDFGGEIEYGDIYYDLAKLKHGIIIQHEYMIQNKFLINLKNKKLTFNFIRNFNHIQCEKIFNNWLNENQFSIKKVNILTSLIFLNIATLHHKYYDQFLFSLGYYLLNEELN